MITKQTTMILNLERGKEPETKRFRKREIEAKVGRHSSHVMRVACVCMYVGCCWFVM